MATQYTSILKLALPVTGELSGTWGDVVNNNITSMVEQAIAGLSTINTWTANAHTLTVADGTTSESRCAMLVAATGAGGTALTAAGEIICPAASKLYVLKNGAAYAVTLKTAAGTGVAVPAGDTAFLFCDGTNVNACVTTIVNGHISGNLTVDGNTTLGDANTDTVTVTAQFASDLLPSTDNARDLGSTAKSWRTLYCDTSVLVGNLSLAGNTLSSTDTNGNIVIAPNGTGDVQLDADTVRVGDSNANATITTNGTGDLILNTNAGTNSGSITIEDGVNGNIIIAPNGTGQVQITNAALDLTTIEVSNINAKDGTAAITIADSTGAVGISTAVTMSATTQNIALGTSQTTGTWTAGGAAQTGTQTFDQSTKTHTLNLGTGATESGLTKTINLGTAGVSGSTTAITVGSANGTTTTLNGTVTAATFNSTTIDTTNIEVTNIKAKDGTAALSIADSTGAVTVATALTANGGAVFNENGANVDFRVEGDTDVNLFFVDASADAVGIGTNAPLGKVHSFSSSSGASPSSNGNQLVLESSGNAGLTIATGASSLGNIFFADSGDNADGYIQYDQSGRSLRFGTATAEKLRITSGGQVNIGGNFTSTNNTLQVTGNAAIGDTLAGPTDGLYVKGSVGIGTNSPAGKLSSVVTAAGAASLTLERTGSSRFEFQQGIVAVTGDALRIRDTTLSYDYLMLRGGNVGINATDPGYKLEVNGGASDAMSLFNSTNANGAHLRFAASGTVKSYIGGAPGFLGSGTADDLGIRAVGSILFATAGSGVDMTLDTSGYLGVGTTTPQTQVHISGAGSQTLALERTGAVVSGRFEIISGNNTNLLRAATAKPLVFEQGTGNPVMRLDTSGNLGLGVEPSAWLSTWKAFQISNRSLAQTGAGAGDLTMVFNGYFDSTDSRWEFQGAGDYAARYSITGAGVHSWHISTAAGANANDPITFTQAMTLDASGNLVVGDTSTSYRLKARADSATGANQDVLQIYNGALSTATASLVFGTGAYAATCRISGATTGANNGALVFGTDGGSGITERARITSVGGFETRPAATGHAVFNEDGVDADFRVESDTQTHMLFVDAGNDRVGIGTNSPLAPLDVTGVIRQSGISTQVRTASNATGGAIFLSPFGDVPITGWIHAVETGTSKYIILACYKESTAAVVTTTTVASNGLGVQATNSGGTVTLNGFTTSGNVKMVAYVIAPTGAS